MRCEQCGIFQLCAMKLLMQQGLSMMVALLSPCARLTASSGPSFWAPCRIAYGFLLIWDSPDLHDFCLRAAATAGRLRRDGAPARAAVLESQAFGAYRPDYAAALRAKDNQDPLARGETLHHDPAAAAAAATLADPGPDPGATPAAAANGGPPPPAAADRGRAGGGARRCAAAVDVQVPPELSKQ